MKSINKFLPLALFLAFFIFGFNVFMQSRPTHKNARVYKIIKEYSPYYIEKRFGGLEILKKDDKEFKEKPSNEAFFKRFEELEREWGKKHIKIDNSVAIIIDNSGKELKRVELKDKKEREFLKKYYGVK
jgi:hypothetical protein